MKKILVGIYDKVSKVFIDYVYHNNSACAIRWFDDLMKAKPNMLNQHPNDYVLYKLAELDDSTGDVKANKCILISGSDYASQSDSEEPTGSEATTNL